MSAIVSIPVEQLTRRSDGRQLDGKVVSAMADSIATIGLLNPVRVRNTGEQYEVIAGAHRLSAHQLLGLVEIDCVIVDDDDLHAELAMIDENLCRAELSPTDRARQTARRKAIYLELHPETGHGGDRKSDQVESISTRSFAAEIASKTGQTDRSVRMHAERGEKVIEEVLDLIRGTKLDTGTYLDKLKKMPPNDQFKAAKRDLAISKAEAKAERQAEFDRQRDESREALPQTVKDAQARKDTAVAARKNKVPQERIDELEAMVDEMREANASYEAELEVVKADNAKWQDMKAQFEQGGFEKVIAGKDEEIRVLLTRVETESRDKASWMKSSKFWKAEAEKLGYGEDDIIPLTPVGSANG
ncbi:ParB/RepB/Spo0J family partition protein [Pelagibacterium sp.]|uniref:ParB/RepB/Spo0J family partition protein n=1 Tax=Pelagibacterium sp. TaxID=1967288 RepID=UPI003A932364